MMKRVILLWLFIFPVFLTFSLKANQLDSLKRVLASETDDTNKVNTLLALSKQYYNSAPQEAINYSIRARNLAQQLNFQRGVAYSLKNIGIAYYMQSKYLETLDYWSQSLKVFETLGDKVGVANLLSNIGAVYFNQADDAKALEYYLRSLNISEQIADPFRIATVCINIGAVYQNKKPTWDKALQYFMRALPLSQRLGNKDAIGTCTVNIGEIYLLKGDDEKALKYYFQSLNAYENSENIPYSLNSIGKVYLKRKNFSTAIIYHQRAYQFSKKLDAKLDMTQSLVGLAKAYIGQGDIKSGLDSYQQALSIATEIKANYEVKNIYEGLTEAYAKRNDFKNAFKYSALLSSIKDTLFDFETAKKLSGLQFNFDLSKKQGQIDLLQKDKALQALNLQRQKVIRNVTIGGLAMVILFLFVVLRQKKKIAAEKKRSDELLLNILPEETAEELKATGTAKAKSFDQVTVMFTDFKNFTQASEKLTAEQLVNEINFCYSEFDRIATKYGIEKIKTIGDSYMCAGGIPVTNSTHPVDVIKAGLEMQEFIKNNANYRKERDEPYFELRLGIHTGPVVAGIVGIKKFAYDIWGDTVNTAARMESSGEVGKVNISGCTYELVKDHFRCTYRGMVQAKNKGEIIMYFVEEIIN
ncbi:MAG: tetratricopeptide repeat protein [Bacteroidetes bacterium]|nr:tetratricopeptide repeat protein [Bacteroidota bacterium]